MIKNGICYRESGYAVNLHYLDRVGENEVITSIHHQKKQLKRKSSLISVYSLKESLSKIENFNYLESSYINDLSISLFNNSEIYSSHSWEPSIVCKEDFIFKASGGSYRCSKKLDFLKNGRLHREEGPSRIYYNKDDQIVYQAWHLEGKRIFFEFFFKEDY